MEFFNRFRKAIATPWFAHSRLILAVQTCLVQVAFALMILHLLGKEMADAERLPYLLKQTRDLFLMWGIMTAVMLYLENCGRDLKGAFPDAFPDAFPAVGGSFFLQSGIYAGFRSYAGLIDLIPFSPPLPAIGFCWFAAGTALGLRILYVWIRDQLPPPPI